ncbi:MAG: N-6 DNA methylase [Bacteroidetes bacterium]|nr:N-6 DNA methylase [Bacteroidota bacterium]
MELGKHPTRTEISELTRAFNRISQKMPVALVLKYQISNEAIISIAISERFKYLQTWRQGEKAGKVIILRDIHTHPQNTHTGHLRILQDLVKPVGVTTYAQLHTHWLQVLDVSILNKKFFQELANWYFWAMDNVRFPDDIEKKKDIRNATNLIRLITRVIFIWFIKEKKLVPNNLFRKEYLDKILNDFAKNKKSENYYNAVLQNLFFGTLNQNMNDRGFVKEGNYQQNKTEYGVKNLFRYADKFLIKEKEVMDLYKNVPFLNGGLFDCLDKPNEAGTVQYVDGFSRNINKQAHVPDYLFFGELKEVDLNEIYGTRNKTYKAQGLINLLNSYKFTVAENTPIEEEIALDPELLGKVFENLLASYNPETQTTARKQTGSFYTPREIVNYMVDESLIEYLKNYLLNEKAGIIELGNNQVQIFGNKDKVGQLSLEQSLKGSKWLGKEKELDEKLRQLFSYEVLQPFTMKEDIEKLIEAINYCKILDPACGSGAFPMGALHKMVHILQKLDIENIYWKELQRQKAMHDTETAYKSDSKEEREKRLIEINDVFENNASDYGRKLYLIENCIYGIDIQPIAVQIAKLRFFISLVIDQNKQEGKANFGIRSLPNLETKFVAANTLIGLNKSVSSKKGNIGTGLLKNLEIETKENLLKDIRHKYFSAKTRKEKLAFQNQDRAIRKEVANLLINDGWEKSMAEQIVAFDPYDQNVFAPFFETEWMFGLTEGFDIIIGNPPYVNVEEIDETIKKNIKRFKTAYQKYDLYVLFYEKAIELLSQNGQLNFITSNKFLSQGYGLILRKEFLKYHLHQIINFNYDVFEAATVRTCILHLQKTLNKPNEKVKIIDIGSAKDSSKFEKLQYNYLNQKIFSDTDENNFRINLTNEKIKVLNNITKDCIRVDDAFSVNYGLRPSSEKLNLKKEAFIHESNPTKKFKKYFEGKDMGYWLIKSFSYLEYRPDVMYNSMFPELFETEKLVGLRTLSDINKLRFIYDNEKFYCNDSVVVLTLWHIFTKINNQTILRNISKMKIETSKQFDYLFVQAILNSQMIKFYVNELLYDGTHFYPNHMKSLPIKNASSSIQKSFVKIIEKIHSAKKENDLADTSKLEKQIDEMVYKLYELTEEEIKIIEGNK